MSKLRKNSATYDDFRGGINDGSDSFVIDDIELAEIKNMDIELMGPLKCRRRQEIYTDMDNSITQAKKPIYQLYRYTTGTNSQRQIIGYTSEGKLITDLNDDKNFQFISGAEATSTLTSNTRFIGVGQFRDTLYFSTDKEKVIAYNPLGTGIKVRDANTSGLTTMHSSFIDSAITGKTGGGLDKSTTYVYGFTINIKLGNNEIAETNAMTSTEYILDDHRPRRNDRPYCRTYFTTSDDISHRVCYLEKRVIKGTEDWPEGAVSINIYRDLGTPNDLWDQDEYDLKAVQIPLYWLDTVSISEFNDRNFGDNFYCDPGHSDPLVDRPIQYGWLDAAPPSRFLCYHKNRMWYFYNYLFIDVTDEYETYPSRGFYSEYQKPENIYGDSWIDINPNDSDEITGAVSWRNKIMIVFKHNSMWAILGADKEIAYGKPDLRLETIDHAVGCVAPHSIKFIEGGAVVWLSNRGPFIFDGSYPQELRADNVRKIINRMTPTGRYNAIGAFNSATRTYYLCLSDPKVDPAPGINNTVLKYSLETHSWTRHQRDNTGFGSFVEVFRGDQENYLLAGLDATDARIGNVGSVVVYDAGESGKDVLYSADPVGAPVYEDISWEVQTKFWDCGREDVDKNFHSVEIQYISQTACNVDFLCDNHYNSANDGNTKTLPSSANPGGGLWGTAVWGAFQWAGVSHTSDTIKLDSNAWGQRIALRFSGGTGSKRPEIQRVTIYFDPKERSR